MQIKGKGYINFNRDFNKSGDNWINFSFTDSYKNKEGEYERAYVNMVAFGENAEAVKKILKSKRTLVELEGFTSGAYKNKLEFCVTAIGQSKVKGKAKDIKEEDLPF